MKKTGYAFFVRRPSILAELQKPHLLEDERSYTIVRVISLGAMDYGNFITDMLADRQFIEDHCALCGEADTWKCLLVQARGHSDGILVMPERGCFVGWAAYVPEV